jgi:MT0933-like antitoxin protein
MGFLDKLKVKASEVKEKAVGAVDEHGDQIKGGIEKAGTFVDKKTKGKYSDKIAKGTQKAGEAVTKLDKSGSPPPAAGTMPPPPAAPPTATGDQGPAGHSSSADRPAGPDASTGTPIADDPTTPEQPQPPTSTL